MCIQFSVADLRAAGFDQGNQVWEKELQGFVARTGEKERTTWKMKCIWKDSININLKEMMA